MTVAARTAEASEHRRRWPRFTLRLLLVAITAVCMGLGIWTHRAREQRRVVERIRKNWGGYVEYHFEQSELSDGMAVGKSVIPQFLLDRLGPDFFHRVQVACVTDRLMLRELPKLRGLEVLLVDCEGIRDADIDALIALPNLTSLSIFANERSSEFDQPPSTHLSDRSLKAIGRLPNLEDLYIDGRGFTSEGVAVLARSRRLRSLYLLYCDSDVEASVAEPLKRTGHFESIEILRWNRTVRKPETIVEWTR